MPKPKDLLREYWELLYELDWEMEESDLEDMDSLRQAVETMRKAKAEIEGAETNESEGNISEKEATD